MERYRKRRISTSSDLCKKIYAEIWYSSGMEKIQVAICHLWGFIAAFKDGHSGSAIMEASASVEVLFLGNTPDPQLLNQYLNTALIIHEKYKGSKNVASS
jgi:hypothetical protein